MEAQQGHSKACCNVPPVVAKGYKEKGKYIDLNGTRCYATGPSHATSAIFIIYDIFGFSSQALQGADILAHADSTHQYQVFMPDFFLGKPLPISVFPPDTDEKKKRMGDFFAGPASPPDTAKKVPVLLKEIEKQATGIKKWASLGMCWGGKVRVPHPDTSARAALIPHRRSSPSPPNPAPPSPPSPKSTPPWSTPPTPKASKSPSACSRPATKTPTPSRNSARL